MLNPVPLPAREEITSAQSRFPFPLGKGLGVRFRGSFEQFPRRVFGVIPIEVITARNSVILIEASNARNSVILIEASIARNSVILTTRAIRDGRKDLGQLRDKRSRFRSLKSRAARAPFAPPQKFRAELFSLIRARPPRYCSHMSIAHNATRLPASLKIARCSCLFQKFSFDGTKLPMVAHQSPATTNGRNRRHLKSAHSLDPQIAPRHLTRRLHSQHPKQRRRHIRQRPAVLRAAP